MTSPLPPLHLFSIRVEIFDAEPLPSTSQLEKSHVPKIITEASRSFASEDCIAMSDVNRRWAMLPRSDRLMGDLENGVEQRKGNAGSPIHFL